MASRTITCAYPSTLSVSLANDPRNALGTADSVSCDATDSGAVGTALTVFNYGLRTALTPSGLAAGGGRAWAGGEAIFVTTRDADLRDAF